MSKKQIQSPALSDSFFKTLKKTPHLIIVGPMPFEWKNLTFSASFESTTVIFIDGGSIHRTIFQEKAPLYLKNSIVIGDGDSSLIAMDITKDDQNVSDLDFFLGMLTKKANSKIKLKSLFFVGFLGHNIPSLVRKNRLDHLIFNIASILKFTKDFKNFKKISISMEGMVNFYPKGTHRLKIKGPFSFLSLWENRLKMTGKCEYQIPALTTISPLSSRGLSNVGKGPIKISASEAFFIIS